MAEPTLQAPAPVLDPVQRHCRGVWRYLRSLGARPGEVEDLVQEAFVVTWQKGMSQLPAAALGAYLRRTARFLFLQRLQGDRRQAEALAEAVDRLWQAHAGDGGDGLLAAVRDCVGRLQGRARQAVELGYGEGLGRAAIAARLGLRDNGVKTLLQRTRQWLRRCIEAVHAASEGEEP